MGSQLSTKLLPPTIRPLSAHIKLTENCQAGCISCDYWKSRWQDRIATDRAVEQAHAILRALGVVDAFSATEAVQAREAFGAAGRVVTGDTAGASAGASLAGAAGIVAAAAAARDAAGFERFETQDLLAAAERQ